MANDEGEIPDLDNLIEPSEEFAPVETETAVEPQTDQTAEPVEAVEPVEPAEPHDAVEPHEPAVKKSGAGLGKLLIFLPILVAIGLPVIMLGLALVGTVFFSTAIYLIAMGFIPLGLWIGRRTNTVYIVFLGCILAAVLTAVYCLWVEVGRYKFDVKVQEAKQRVGVVCPIDESRGLC